MKSNLISKSETSDILADIREKWDMDIPKSKNLRVYEIQNDAQLITGEGFVALKIGEEYLPYLSETTILEKFPHVMVDMGAVRFMCNGANVMRPGIIRYTEFHKDQIVCVIEESQHKFLAVGKAMIDSSEMESMKKGEIVKNIHYISDRYWEIGKTVIKN